MFSPPPDACPFCGVTVEDPAIVGANFEVCLSCPDTMTRWLDAHYWVLSSTTYRIFTYNPWDDAWDRQRPPTVVTRESTADHLAAEDLTAEDRELATALATEGPPARLTAVDPDELAIERVRALVPTDLGQSDLSERTVKTLRSQVPEPTVFVGAAPAAAAIYTTDGGRLRDVLSAPAAGTEQQTLG